MDLWISSQSNGLYKLKIILPPFEDGSLWGKIEGECILLGQYKSKERALKVLDEIQERILDVYAIKTILNIQDKNVIRAIINKYEGKNTGCIYKMPSR